jgi:hypothetical protein
MWRDTRAETLEFRRQRVQLDTDRHRITGTITLPADHHHGRLSDLLNATERDFIALTDVVIERHDGGPAEQHHFTAVSRHRIRLVSALD